MSFNLASILRETTRVTPDKAALLFMGQSMTYSELDDLSTRFAVGLRKLGLRRGDVVAVMLPNLPQFPVAYFGILKAGMTIVPLNPLLKAPEVAYHLGDSEARLLVGCDMFAAEAVAGAAQQNVPLHLVRMSGEQDPSDGARSFDELLAEVDPASIRNSVEGDIVPTMADDTAVLLYTSGTTGKPKGAELTHFQLFMNCTTAGGVFEAQDDDVALAVLPFFHVFGLSSVLNLGIRYGGTLSVVPRFDAKLVLDTMEADRVTIFLGVPTMYFALLAEDLNGRILPLRMAGSGGASMPGEVLREFETKFGVVVLEGYGLSESASSASFNISAEERKVLSIGKPMWGVEMRVVNTEDQPLPPGADNYGEIVIRGHNIMKGYRNRPEETAAAFRNGWFHTGDVGYADDDGFFFIVDRLKDLVIRGGYNVYPREIEEILYEHPMVAEAAVIGKPDPKLGEEVVAVVALKDGTSATPEEIVGYCKERLAAYKYPREVRILNELPKGPTGKILKKELRA